MSIGNYDVYKSVFFRDKATGGYIVEASDAEIAAKAAIEAK
jgi:hypothetical protein